MCGHTTRAIGSIFKTDQEAGVYIGVGPPFSGRKVWKVQVWWYNCK